MIILESLQTSFARAATPRFTHLRVDVADDIPPLLEPLEQLDLLDKALPGLRANTGTRQPDPLERKLAAVRPDDLQGPSITVIKADTSGATHTCQDTKSLTD